MTTARENDAARRRQEHGKRLLSRLQREDETEFRTSHVDPEFTTHELALIIGKTERHTRRMLLQAKVGRICVRTSPGGVPTRTLVVRWSQLESLMTEFGWA